MKMNEEKIGRAVVLELSGKLDFTNSEEFEARLVDLIDDRRVPVVIDLAGLSYISSSGLRAFLMAAQRTEAFGSSMALCCLQDDVREVFDVAGFSALFKIYEDRDAALAAI